MSVQTIKYYKAHVNNDTEILPIVVYHGEVIFVRLRYGTGDLSSCGRVDPNESKAGNLHIKRVLSAYFYIDSLKGISVQEVSGNKIFPNKYRMLTTDGATEFWSADLATAFDFCDWTLCFEAGMKNITSLMKIS